MNSRIRKFLCLVLVLLTALSSAACGSSGKDSGSSGKKPSTKVSSSKSDKKDDDKSDKDDDGKRGKADSKSDDRPAATEAAPAATEPRASSSDYTLKDETLVDNDQVTAIIKSISYDWQEGLTVNIYYENKTNDSLVFCLDDPAANGYLVSGISYETLAPGKKCNSTMTVYANDLNEVGVKSVDQLSLQLSIYDSEDFSKPRLVDEFHTLYPTGKSASQIVIPPRRTTANEKVIIDDSNVAFVILGCSLTDSDDYYGLAVDCYLENKTDKSTMFAWDDVSINGFMIDPFWANEVAPHTREYSTIHFRREDIDSNGITAVEEIEFNLRAYDNSDWLHGQQYVKSTFTYEP